MSRADPSLTPIPEPEQAHSLSLSPTITQLWLSFLRNSLEFRKYGKMIVYDCTVHTVHIHRAAVATGYRLANQRVEFQSRQSEFSLLHIALNGPGTHPTSYSMSAVASFPRVKDAGA
jgi:hypothetical protein